ncbi:hypothetical protein Ahy_A02g009185 [Arachis hypogaea]|uniref:Rho termination factor-like N-terminal domain-containing protein n=1 Tax=Arachis hypogaea TaxID=3818 RepID=A0A445EG65_ARAHY|nr:hypothetical protein Ahy_A02g009185 [Arachis hypogaea]
MTCNISNKAKQKDLSEKISAARNEKGAEGNPHKSPIPSPLSTPRSNTIEHTNYESSNISLETTVQPAQETLEEMKLAELKKLAKSRGIKGSSKLKKIELIKNNSFVLNLKPLHCIFFGDPVLNSNTGLSSPPPTHTIALAVVTLISSSAAIGQNSGAIICGHTQLEEKHSLSRLAERDSSPMLMMMDVVAFHSYSVLGFSFFTSFSLSKHCYLAEVQVQPSPFAFKMAVSPFTNSKIIRSKGDIEEIQTSRKIEDKRSKSF